MDIDKQKLHNELTELVGATFYSMQQQFEGKYPTQYDITKWRDLYQGRTNLPQNMVELNTFKMMTDYMVGNIMMLIDNAST